MREKPAEHLRRRRRVGAEIMEATGAGVVDLVHDGARLEIQDHLERVQRDGLVLAERPHGRRAGDEGALRRARAARFEIFRRAELLERRRRRAARRAEHVERRPAPVLHELRAAPGEHDLEHRDAHGPVAAEQVQGRRRAAVPRQREVPGPAGQHGLEGRRGDGLVLAEAVQSGEADGVVERQPLLRGHGRFQELRVERRAAAEAHQCARRAHDGWLTRQPGCSFTETKLLWL